MSVAEEKVSSAPASASTPAGAGQDGVLLSIQDLRVWYELRRFGFGLAGYVRAVDGVSFDLDHGEAIAVVGESGCGKSSLMKTILGLVSATGGAVVFKGQRVSELRGGAMHWYRSQVGYVQQDPYGALPPFMSVRGILEEPIAIDGMNKARLTVDNAMMGRLPAVMQVALPIFLNILASLLALTGIGLLVLAILGIAIFGSVLWTWVLGGLCFVPLLIVLARWLAVKIIYWRSNPRLERMRRIREALEKVKMTPVEDFLPKFPHMLSGGQQQRVVIARAMILDPRLLVADEPVSMLDASVRVEILRLLQALQQRLDLGVIYITHDLSTVRYFSERIFVMYAGQVVEKAPVDTILHRSRHPYTHALLEATSDPDANNATKYRDVPPGEPPSLVKPPSGCRFHPRCVHMIRGLCEVEEPPEFEMGPDHLVKCWLCRP